MKINTMGHEHYRWEEENNVMVLSNRGGNSLQTKQRYEAWFGLRGVFRSKEFPRYLLNIKFNRVSKFFTI